MNELETKRAIATVLRALRANRWGAAAGKAAAALEAAGLEPRLKAAIAAADARHERRRKA